MGMTGNALIADINSQAAPAGTGYVWWLGQHSFVLKLGPCVIYLDPFLTPSPRRRVPPLLSPGQLANADLILGTHEHTDHIDKPSWPQIATASPRARFVVPELLRERLASETGIRLERFVGCDDGKVLHLDGIQVEGVAAAHEFLDRDPTSGQYPSLGFIVRGHGCAIYHAGDTCVYEGLQRRLSRSRLDLAMLPINGRDAERLARNCIGNMTYQEAVDLAGALAPGLTVPAHFDMFAGNTEAPELFAAYMQVKFPHVRAVVPGYGERIVFETRPRSATQQA